MRWWGTAAKLAVIFILAVHLAVAAPSYFVDSVIVPALALHIALPLVGYGMNLAVPRILSLRIALAVQNIV